VAIAYLLSIFREPELDIDIEDKAIKEASIKILREAEGRIMI